MRAVTLCLAVLGGCAIDFESQPLGGPDASAPVVPDAGTPKSPVGDFAAFMACMQFSDFVAADMAGAWGSLVAGITPCRSCHSEVEYSGDPVAFFDELKLRTYLQLTFFSYDGFGVIVNDQLIMDVAKAVVPHTQHPKFNPIGGLQATEALRGMTMARLLSGTCTLP